MRAHPSRFQEIVKIERLVARWQPLPMKPEWIDRIRAALLRMKALRGVCEGLSDLGLDLLNQGRIRVFDAARHTTLAGGAPMNGLARGDAWITTANGWVERYYDAPKTDDQYGPRNLQHQLAHELDHNASHYFPNGSWHAANNPTHTLNSFACSGL